MEDVKAEPKSPPPPKQQVRALFLLDLQFLFPFLCLLLYHLASLTCSVTTRSSSSLSLPVKPRVVCWTVVHPGKAANAWAAKAQVAKASAAKAQHHGSSSSCHPYSSLLCITYLHYVCASAAQELAPEIAARIAEAERIAAEAEAEAGAYAEHAAAIQAEHDLQQHQVHPLTCLCFRLLMIPSRRALALSCSQSLYDTL